MKPEREWNVPEPPNMKPPEPPNREVKQPRDVIFLAFMVGVVSGVVLSLFVNLIFAGLTTEEPKPEVEIWPKKEGTTIYIPSSLNVTSITLGDGWVTYQEKSD